MTEYPPEGPYAVIAQDGRLVCGSAVVTFGGQEVLVDSVGVLSVAQGPLVTLGGAELLVADVETVPRGGGFEVVTKTGRPLLVDDPGTTDTSHSILRAMQAVKAVDTMEKIRNTPWATAIYHMDHKDISNIQMHLEQASWAFTAADVLKLRWPRFDLATSEEDREKREMEFRWEIANACPGTGAFLSHSFTNREVRFTCDNFTTFMQYGMILIDVLNPPDNMLPMIAGCFSHNKGYAVTADIISELSATHTVVSSDGTGLTLSQVDSTGDLLPRPVDLINELYGVKWEAHPFKRTPNWNKEPIQALGDELSNYNDKELKGCVTEIWFHIYRRFNVDNFGETKKWITYWKDRGLAQAINRIANNQSLADRIVGALAAFDPSDLEDI